MKSKLPPYLKIGDTIGLTCTARSACMEDLQPAIQYLEQWGFKVRLGSCIGKVEHQFGGTSEERAQSMQELLDDENVKAIWICRGGYGTIKMLDLLDFTKFEQHPKWIVGFSDITILHSYLTQRNIASLHATMPTYFPKFNNKQSVELLAPALKGSAININFESQKANRMGSADGLLVGGNLSILYSLLGTDLDIDTDNKILFIEDLDEYLYHIDRIMISLNRAGKLSKLKALIVGGLSDMNDHDIPFGKNAVEIIQEHIAEFNYPVCFDFPAGHIYNTLPIRLGAKCSLVVGENEVVFEQ